VSIAVAVSNIVLGTVYTSYGVMTVLDLKAGWRELGFSPFGMAWILMAFTCGPHHLVHGVHALEDGRSGTLDLAVVLVGFPAGVTWFLLRVEALLGGRGDRVVRGNSRWVSFLPVAAAVYVVAVAAAVARLLGGRAAMTPRMVPNVLLLGLYGLIGFYLLRTQLANHSLAGDWSLSGLSLTVVFPTCGVMHAVYAVYAATGAYHLDWHGLAIDWLAVPAAVYFVWVVRMLHLGLMREWNGSAEGVRLAGAFA
jgi:hypothetical protein